MTNAANDGSTPAHPWPWWPFAALAGGVVGFVTGRSIPPFYPDESWWGTFLTSAGFGGSLAVLGAFIAAFIAFHNSRSDRRARKFADDRNQWWERFTWACEKAVSRTPGHSEVGLLVLMGLLDSASATQEDNEMVIGIANVIRAGAAEHKKGLWRR